jgi:hypothetical protein
MTRAERIEAIARVIVNHNDIGQIRVREQLIGQLRDALDQVDIEDIPKTCPHGYSHEELATGAVICDRCKPPLHGPAGADWREK